MFLNLPFSWRSCVPEKKRVDNGDTHPWRLIQYLLNALVIIYWLVKDVSLQRWVDNSSLPILARLAQTIQMPMMKGVLTLSNSTWRTWYRLMGLECSVLGGSVGSSSTGMDMVAGDSSSRGLSMSPSPWGDADTAASNSNSGSNITTASPAQSVRGRTDCLHPSNTIATMERSRPDGSSRSCSGGGRGRILPRSPLQRRLPSPGWPRTDQSLSHISLSPKENSLRSPRRLRSIPLQGTHIYYYLNGVR